MSAVCKAAKIFKPVEGFHRGWFCDTITETPHDAEDKTEKEEIRVNIITLEQVDSTQNYLKQHPELGVGTAVLAMRQTAGRGRLGRSFASPEGMGMYLSAVLDAGHAPLITPRAAVAGRLALQRVGVDCGIKWVNDLVAERDGKFRKLCGILAEMVSVNGEQLSASNVPRGTFRRIILGVGIDLKQREDDFPPELREICTSVAMEGGRAVEPREMAEIFLEELERALELTSDELYDEYAANCVTVGREVLVKRTPDDPGVPARAVGLSRDFSVEVEYPDGRRERVSSGEASVKLG